MAAAQYRPAPADASPDPSRRYDKGYFDKWYRGEGFGSPARLARKAHYALSAAEYLLERPVRTVLDIGCGEAPWRAALHKLRPAIRYTGVDPSEYAVERYGKSRGIHLGEFGGLDAIEMRGSFDLIVCADVILYVDDAALRRGLIEIAARLNGVAYVEIFTANDRIEGDLSLFHKRKPQAYERAMNEAGLRWIGPHLYAGRRVMPTLADFEGGLRK